MISGFRNLYDKEPMEMTVARFVDWIRTNGEVKDGGISPADG